MSKARTHTLNAVFDLLDQTGIPYCVQHGYEGFPDKLGSDVDLIVPANVTAERLAGLFAKNREMLAARIVRRNGASFFVLLCERELATPQFLMLDFSAACEIQGAVFLDGAAILQSRQRRDNYWIPSPAVEFHCLLARRIAKGSLDEARAAHLSELYRNDPAKCRSLLGTVWQPGTLDHITRAAGGGDWSPIQQKLSSLKSELKHYQAGGKLLSSVRQWFATQIARIKRFLRPPGFHLVMLGPDGAGKSSVIDALEKSMVGPFARVHTLGFAPPIYKLWRKGPVKTDTPHALAPRSYAVSMLRALFWLVYNLSGYVSLRWAKSRSTLVLNDRHFIDILVDPVRYRYGGPKWILHLIRKLIPAPDAIVLLHGPPEVLQARKRELTLAETERQCRDYLALVRGQRHSHIVNAAQPFDLVMRDVCDIIFAPRKS
jgi:thymidylate kinase